MESSLSPPKIQKVEKKTAVPSTPPPKFKIDNAPLSPAVALSPQKLDLSQDIASTKEAIGAATTAGAVKDEAAVKEEEGEKPQAVAGQPSAAPAEPHPEAPSAPKQEEIKS